MPHEFKPPKSPPAERGGWFKVAAMHFARMETDEKYRNEVKRRTYGLDAFPPHLTQEKSRADN